MADNSLHITNGGALTARLEHHFPKEDIITWNEILCEGPSVPEVFSEEFNSLRSSFIIENFEGTTEEYQRFVQQFKDLNTTSFDGLVLWFEYDLFCQINLAALAYFLKEISAGTPLYLVCSGKIEGSNRLFGLNELNDEQLFDHFRNKTLLKAPETDQLSEFWKLYTSSDPLELAATSFTSEKLPYLESARMAHLARFPDRKKGINEPERMVLDAIFNNSFENERKLLGYLLRNQGYYGFGDLQWEKIVQKMDLFYTTEGSLCLTSEGEKLLHSEINVFEQMKDATQFGGCSKYDYIYDRTSKKLTTT